MSQTQFTKDLIDFIESHEYYKSQTGHHKKLAFADLHKFEIHDPNGDYERIKITIDSIA